VEQRVRLTALLLILLWPSCLIAEYVSSEILVIPWGEGPNELEIWEPIVEYDVDSGGDTTFYAEEAGGPSDPFVDSEENVYFISYQIAYLKGFNIEGEVIVDYSDGKTDFRDEFFRGMFSGFYVDSLGRFFCDGNLFIGGYVAVADRANNLLDKLNPLGLESGVPCFIVRWGANDVLTFKSLEHGNFTYVNGEFNPGGSSGWRAVDGYYYRGDSKDSSTIMLMRFENPDTLGIPLTIDTLYIPFEPGNLVSAGLIGTDLEMNFYMKLRDSAHENWGVRVYDQNLDMIDDFRLLEREDNKYLWDTPYPFLRDDGNLYEFHCRDDGMHIFRWSRE
jgi:hypothetical protein